LTASIREADQSVAVKLFNLAKTDKNDAITEIFKSKAVVLGSLAVNNRILVSVAGLLEEMTGLKFKNKKAGAFGSYGWSGEAVKLLSEKLADAGFDVVDQGIRAMWSPDQNDMDRCREYGRSFVASL
jgi:anaerobic nitric oxide reductase flavorubredoxin